MHAHSLGLSFFACLIALPACLATARAENRPIRLDRFGDVLPDGAILRIGAARLRHTSRIAELSFSPNGKYLLSSGDGAIRAWESATGRQLYRVSTQITDPSFALSADGSMLAVGDEFDLHLLDAGTGRKHRTIDEFRVPGQDCTINHLFLSSDGKTVAAFHPEMGSGAKFLSRWDTATGKKIGVWRLGADRFLAISPAGRIAASKREKASLKESKNSADILRLWDTTTQKGLREWEVPGGVPWRSRCLTFSPDGRFLASAGNDARIRVHETATGKEVRSWNGCTSNYAADPNSEVVAWLAFSPDGRTLASVECNRLLHLWDWKTGRELRHFEHIVGPIAFSPDGKLIAAGDEENRIRLWDAATGKERYPFADPGRVTDIAFSVDGRPMAAISREGKVRLLDVTAGREWTLTGYDLRAIAPDGGSVLALCRGGDRNGPLCLLDAATGKERIRFRGTNEKDDLGGWNPNRKMLVTVARQSTRAWDSSTGDKRLEFPVGGFGASVSPDARTVAFAERSTGVIRLFAADTGKELQRLTGYKESLNYSAVRGRMGRGVGNATVSPVFSADGKTLLAGTDGNCFALWDVTTGKRLFRLRCADLLPLNPAFSPAGELLALLDTHGDPCLIDSTTGRVRYRLTGSEGDVNWIWKSPRTFSADGRLFAAGFDEHTLLLWETVTGQPIRLFPGHGQGMLEQMHFSPDGRRLATLCTDGTALVWDVIGLSPDGRLPERKLTSAEAEQAWRNLAEMDAVKAHRAIWSLVADPARALPLLRQCLPPTPRIEPQRLARLVADLDSDAFAVREKATKELRKVAEVAAPALRQAIKDRPSPELRRRAQQLLSALDTAAGTADQLRQPRALAVLEYIANTESRQLLRALADGATESRLTHEAKESLQRLTKQQQPKGDREKVPAPSRDRERLGAAIDRQNNLTSIPIAGSTKRSSPPRRPSSSRRAKGCLMPVDRILPCLCFASALLLPSAVVAEAPLHERIDRVIAAHESNFAARAAAPAADTEFLRRVYLDLTGTIPTAEQTRSFLKDNAPAKRQKLIDRLMASPEHARHMADWLDVTLMERRKDKNVPHAQWLEYLRSSMAENKPWDRLVREILSSDGADAKQRAAAKFYLDRNAEPNVLTRDISRLFLGTNLQCCQCHDHPRIDDYKQLHYYGIFAFVSRSSLVIDKKLKQAVLSEKADGDVTFQSVFDPAKKTKRTGPRLPEKPPLTEPTVEKGKEYVAAPKAGARAVPRFSRRALLGPALARGDNEAFKRNIANRLWALMMGRGLVHPLDLDHSANPPSHPELLTMLADDIAARKFDMRGFLRELALSQTYQRSSEPPAGVKEAAPTSYTVALLKPLTPEQLAWSLMQATGLTDAERQALGKKATNEVIYTRLVRNVTPFVRTFGSPAGTPEEFDARLEQALFLANGSTVRGWLTPRPGNLIDRLAKLANADALAEELYVSVFTRLPSAEERKEVADYLASRPRERSAALQDMAWALLASAEFRFNH